jgi:hypothetical protein
MSRFMVLGCLLVMIPLLAWAQCKDCPGKSGEGRCSCSEFHRYQGDAMLSAFTVTIKAESQCANGFKLLLRDTRGRKITEIMLTGPHAGEQTFNVKLDTEVRADAVRQGVLLNATSSDVKITYMKLIGTLSDGEFKYFEKECPGIVIGAKGCQRMVLYEGI